MIRLDLTGQRFGRLIVVRQADSTTKKKFWVCVCDCGTEVVINRIELRNGDTQSCGCLQAERAAEACRNRAFKLVGQRFGPLVVLSEAEPARPGVNGQRRRRWLCKCDCGKEVVVQQTGLHEKKALCSHWCGLKKQFKKPATVKKRRDGPYTRFAKIFPHDLGSTDHTIRTKKPGGPIRRQKKGDS